MIQTMKCLTTENEAVRCHVISRGMFGFSATDLLRARPKSLAVNLSGTRIGQEISDAFSRLPPLEREPQVR
jgi:hypothetical protein